MNKHVFSMNISCTKRVFPMNISWTKHAVWSPVIVGISQFVHSQCLSCPGYLPTDVARMRDASDMICFHMTSHIVKRCLFSTNIAGGQKSSAMPRRDIAFGDHGFDLLIQIMEFYICRCVCDQFVVLAFGALCVRCRLWSNLINWVLSNFCCQKLSICVFRFGVMRSPVFLRTAS